MPVIDLKNKELPSTTHILKNHLISLGILEAKVLSISRIPLSNEMVKALCELLNKNKVIEVLSFNDNGFTEEGVKYIAHFLEQSKTLKSLELLYNPIGSKGTQYISDALGVNTSVEELDLGGCHIGNAGAEHIIDAISQHPLRTIGLNYNSIDDRIVRNLFYKISDSCIETLLLEGNSLTQFSLHKLDDILHTIPHLTEVGIIGDGYLHYTDLSFKIKKKIDQNIASLKNQLSDDLDEIPFQQSSHLCIYPMTLDKELFEKLIDTIEDTEELSHALGIVINGYQRLSKEELSTLYAVSHKLSYLEMNSMAPIDTWENIYMYRKNKPKNDVDRTLSAPTPPSLPALNPCQYRISSSPISHEKRINIINTFLEKKRNTYHLDLNNEKQDLADMYLILNALPFENQTIDHLNLSLNETEPQIDLNHFESLLDLINHADIKALSLSIKTATDDAVLLIASMIQYNTALKHLSLEIDRLSNDGATALSRAFSTNKTISRFFVDQDTQINRQGIESLVHILRNNHTLTDFEVPGMFRDKTLINCLNDNKAVFNNLPVNAENIGTLTALKDRSDFFHYKFVWEEKICGTEFPYDVFRDTYNQKQAMKQFIQKNQSIQFDDNIIPENFFDEQKCPTPMVFSTDLITETKASITDTLQNRDEELTPEVISNSEAKSALETRKKPNRP